jgi:hypothetical protein
MGESIQNEVVGKETLDLGRFKCKGEWVVELFQKM